MHEVAQQAASDARVVYVDNDPVAVEHSRAILTGNPRTAVVEADLRDPDSVLGDPALARMLDLSRPVAMLMVAVLHFVPEEADPAGLVAWFRDAIGSGSFLALSHASTDGQPERTAEHRGLYQRTATPMTMRTRAEIATGSSGSSPAWCPCRCGGRIPRRRWRNDRNGSPGSPGSAASHDEPVSGDRAG